MKGKWDCLVYLELFTGPGRALVEETGRVIDTAPLRALRLDPGFDVHIYSELDAEMLAALRARCRSLKPEANCRFVAGDVNESWPKSRAEIRRIAGSGSSLTFCFVDPYKCADLSFATIKGLSEIYVDFLILIPSFMDANRQESINVQGGSEIIDRFLGDAKWRDEWRMQADRRRPFGSFVADQFGMRMRGLRFRYDGLADMKLMRSTEKNLRLYHLAFFSRSDLGAKLWREAMKSSDPQRRLF